METGQMSAPDPMQHIMGGGETSAAETPVSEPAGTQEVTETPAPEETPGDTSVETPTETPEQKAETPGQPDGGESISMPRNQVEALIARVDELTAKLYGSGGAEQEKQSEETPEQTPVQTPAPAKPMLDFSDADFDEMMTNPAKYREFMGQYSNAFVSEASSKILPMAEAIAAGQAISTMIALDLHKEYPDFNPGVIKQAVMDSVAANVGKTPMEIRADASERIKREFSAYNAIKKRLDLRDSKMPPKGPGTTAQQKGEPKKRLSAEDLMRQIAERTGGSSKRREESLLGLNN